MSTIDIDPDSAAAGSAAARQRLAGTLGELQSRLSPKALARDAVQELKETGQELARDGLDAARRHPLTLAGAASGVIIFLLRRPLGRLFGRGKDATGDRVASLTSDRPGAPKRPSAKKRIST